MTKARSLATTVIKVMFRVFLFVTFAPVHAGSDEPRIVMSKAILDATENQLSKTQVKITYLGAQAKPILTVAFSVAGYEMSIDRFRHFQPQGQAYGNDELPGFLRFTVAPGELRRILQAVKPVLSNKEVAQSREFLAFGVMREREGGFEGCEFRINSTWAEDFYSKLIEAVDAKNDSGREVLNKQFLWAVPTNMRKSRQSHP